PETRVEMAAGDLEADEMEVGVVHVEPGPGVVAQPGGAEAGALGRVARDEAGRRAERQARMGERIALRPRFADQDRGPRVGPERARVDREVGDQSQRLAPRAEA